DLKRSGPADTQQGRQGRDERAHIRGCGPRDRQNLQRHQRNHSTVPTRKQMSFAAAVPFWPVALITIAFASVSAGVVMEGAILPEAPEPQNAPVSCAVLLVRRIVAVCTSVCPLSATACEETTVAPKYRRWVLVLPLAARVYQTVTRTPRPSVFSNPAGSV